MINLKIIIIGLMLVLHTNSLHAQQLAVIVNPDNPVALTNKTLYRLFFGKSSTFPNGNKATPLVLTKNTAQLNIFAKHILGRSANQLRSYWAKQVFTGKGNPPQEVSSIEEMKSLVGSNKEYVGYLWLSDVDESVTPIMVIDAH